MSCRIISATRAWYHDIDHFESEVKSAQDLIDFLSLPEYPGGAPKDPEFVMGNLEYESDNRTISFIPAYFATIMLPDKGDETLEFEASVIENLLALKDVLDKDGGNLQLSFLAHRSFQDEFLRAIEEDMYLIPLVALIMSVFNCAAYFSRDSGQSRCLLGLGSLFTITMALFSGFGLLFTCGK